MLFFELTIGGGKKGVFRRKMRRFRRAVRGGMVLPNFVVPLPPRFKKEPFYENY